MRTAGTDIQDDVLDPSAEQIMNGSSIVTDGDWLWREDLAYYLRRHNVALPSEFLALIRARNYEVPGVDPESLSRCADEAERLMF